jgi:hypothetical protein
MMLQDSDLTILTLFPRFFSELWESLIILISTQSKHLTEHRLV